MRILINNVEVETNPTGCNDTKLLFQGTIHDGSGLTETVYGNCVEDVVNLARFLKTLKKSFNTVHVYTPEHNGKRVHVKFCLI